MAEPLGQAQDDSGPENIPLTARLGAHDAFLFGCSSGLTAIGIGAGITSLMPETKVIQFHLRDITLVFPIEHIKKHLGKTIGSLESILMP